MANKGFGVLHGLNEVGAIAKMIKTRTHEGAVVVASKICFLVKDTLTIIAFFEKCAVLAAGTAQNAVTRLTSWTGLSLVADSFGRTFEYHGWSLSATHHIAAWQNDAQVVPAGKKDAVGYWNSLHKGRVLDLALDATKLLGIGLANSPALAPLQFVAFLGQSTVAITRGAIENAKAKPATAA